MPTGALAVALLGLAEGPGPVVHVARDARRLDDLAATLRALDPDARVAVYPEWDCLPFDHASPSRATMGARAAVLRWLTDRDALPDFVLTTAPGPGPARAPAGDLGHGPGDPAGRRPARRRRGDRRPQAPRLHPRRAGRRARRDRGPRPHPGGLPRRRAATLPDRARGRPRHRHPLLRPDLAALGGGGGRPRRRSRHRDRPGARLRPELRALHRPGAPPGPLLPAPRHPPRLRAGGAPRGRGRHAGPDRRLLRADGGGAGAARRPATSGAWPAPASTSPPKRGTPSWRRTAGSPPPRRPGSPAPCRLRPGAPAGHRLRQGRARAADGRRRGGPRRRGPAAPAPRASGGQDRRAPDPPDRRLGRRGRGGPGRRPRPGGAPGGRVPGPRAGRHRDRRRRPVRAGGRGGGRRAGDPADGRGRPARRRRRGRPRPRPVRVRGAGAGGDARGGALRGPAPALRRRRDPDGAGHAGGPDLALRAGARRRHPRQARRRHLAPAPPGGGGHHGADRPADAGGRPRPPGDRGPGAGAPGPRHGAVRRRLRLRADPRPGRRGRRPDGRPRLRPADGPAGLRRCRVRQDRGGAARAGGRDLRRQAGRADRPDHRAGAPARRDPAPPLRPASASRSRSCRASWRRPRPGASGRGSPTARSGWWSAPTRWPGAACPSPISA